MPNRKTLWTNAWESTAPSGLSDVATLLTVADASALNITGGVGGYIVIEPDNPSQREFLYITAKTGNDLTISERYLAGSAAGSGLTHPANAVVRTVALAQGFEDLHDRIDQAEADILAIDPAGNYLPLAGGTMAGDIAMGNNQITGLPTPSLASEPATKNYVDLQITGHTAAGDPHSQYLTQAEGDALYAAAGAYLALSGGVMTGNIDLNNVARIVNLPDPTLVHHPVTLQYADATYLGLTANAASATKWQTARTLSLTGDVTGTSAAFDGTGNISITTVVGNDSHTHGDSTINGLNASAITTGTLSISRIPTGTSSSTVALGNHTHSGYLTTSGKAADSNLLDGLDSTAFLRSNTDDTFTGNRLTFNDVTNTEVIYISATQGKNHIVWSNNPYTNGVGDYQAYWDNDILGTNVGWAISTTLSSSATIKKRIRDYDVDGVGAALLRIPLRSWEYDATALAIAGFPSHLDGHMPKDGDGPTRHWFVAEEVEAELPWLVDAPNGDSVKRIKDGRPLQMAMLAALQHLNRRLTAAGI